VVQSGHKWVALWASWARAFFVVVLAASWTVAAGATLEQLGTDPGLGDVSVTMPPGQSAGSASSGV
jgi:hypothetical protein